MAIPVTDAGIGVFPYFKILPNFYVNDSATIDFNKTYFFDGKKFFAVEGKVSRQNLGINDPNGKTVSEFGCIQAFDKVVAALGGLKVFTGKFPEDRLKAFAGADMVELGSRSQIAPSGYYGIAEYVIKTAENEVWAQLQPYSLGSHFYSLLIVERETPLLQLNTNRENNILGNLQRTKSRPSIRSSNRTGETCFQGPRANF